jgi:hypothetical protein
MTVERPDIEFTGLSDITGDTVLGYTDAGLATFVRQDDDFIEVDGADANRLLGTQINSDGVVVGYASWGDDPLWDPLSRGFVATPAGGRYHAEPFGIAGMARTSVVGITDDGLVAGHVSQEDDSTMVAYSANLDDPDGTLELYQLPDEITALLSTPGTVANVWGSDSTGRIFGTLFLTDPEPELWDEDGVCGGHGHLHGTECHCDDGYSQDPDDPAVCILDAEN